MKVHAQVLTRREEILEVSARLFKEKGYSATTMREIAEQIGMEAASMYNHIKGKDELLSEICSKVAEDYIFQIENIDTFYSTPTEKMIELIRRHIQIVCNNIDGVSVANNEWRHLPEPSLSKFKKARQEYENRMGLIIQDGIKNNEFQDVNVTVALYTLLSAIRWVEVWYKPNKKMSQKVLEDNIIRILIQGLQKVS